MRYGCLQNWGISKAPLLPEARIVFHAAVEATCQGCECIPLSEVAEGLVLEHSCK